MVFHDKFWYKIQYYENKPRDMTMLTINILVKEEEKL
jgi:hypothetical protein